MVLSSRVLFTCPDDKKYYIPFYHNYSKGSNLSTNKSILNISDKLLTLKPKIMAFSVIFLKFFLKKSGVSQYELI